MCSARCCGVALWALTVSNNGHVPNVLRIVHETTDLALQSVSHAESSCPSSLAQCGATSVLWACVGVCATYLLDREAVILSATCFWVASHAQNKALELCRGDSRERQTYLTMMAVLVLSSFTKIQ